MNYEALDAKRPFLDTILTLLPGAVIAGGFLRDLALDRPTRDIDILVEKVPTARQLDGLGNFLGAIMASVGHEDWGCDTEEYQPEDGRTSVINCLFKDIKTEICDVIVVTDVQAHISEFPDSVSGIWYDTWGYWRKSDFVYSHANKVVTYRDGAPQARLDKLKAKFPEYTVKIVPGYNLPLKKEA